MCRVPRVHLSGVLSWQGVVSEERISLRRYAVIRLESVETVAKVAETGNDVAANPVRDVTAVET